jgi:hypothetical protein
MHMATPPLGANIFGGQVRLFAKMNLPCLITLEAAGDKAATGDKNIHAQ